MQELVELLNRARRAYEQEDTEIMSNYEYDRLYDELEGLERELGTTLASSPTVNVGYEVLSELPKERHEKPMLSLDKTKTWNSEIIFRRAKGRDLLEDGRTDDRSDISERAASKSGHKREMGEVGEVITNKCEGISQTFSFRSQVSGRTDPAWGSRDWYKEFLSVSTSRRGCRCKI